MKHDETVNDWADRIVRQEVLCCMSCLVYALNEANVMPSRSPAIGELANQAFELSMPILDYEEAAIQAGWVNYKDEFGVNCYRNGSDTWACGDWQLLCEAHDIDPYEHEVFEHWAVTSWLADKLIEKGEKVDKDFANLCVWARTTTGHGIAQDGVIQEIAADVLKAVA